MKLLSFESRLSISKLALLDIIFGAVLIFIALYQIEVIEWQKYHLYPTFAGPFGLRLEFWLARDILYTMIVVGWLLTLGAVLTIRGVSDE